MCSRHINPSSYFLMNIDRLSDGNDPKSLISQHLTGHNSSHSNGRQKRTLFEQLKPSQLIRSSHYYNTSGGGGAVNVSGNQNVAGGNANGLSAGGHNRRGSSNNRHHHHQNHPFVDEVNVRNGNFFMHHHSHLINQQMAAQNLRGGGRVTINLNRLQQVDSRDVSRCAVCVLL